MHRLLLLALITPCLAACGQPPGNAAAQTQQGSPTATAAPIPVASALGGQQGNGLPYQVVGSEVWDVPDPVSGRQYQVFVALPPDYAEHPDRHYPVLYVTDADYAFPLIRQMARRLNGEGRRIEDFILVGLSYAIGEDGMTSRRRDYTPTAKGPSGAPANAVHGGGAAYITYLREQVLPFVATRYRSDEQQRLFLGHSYGALLGTQILLTEPTLFSGYILGSPSYWYDDRVMQRMESKHAQAHDDLPANVYMYIGQYEGHKPGDPRYATGPDMVTDAITMETSLRSRQHPSLRLTLDVLNDEDHLSVAPRGFMHGLKYLLAADAAKE